MDNEDICSLCKSANPPGVKKGRAMLKVKSKINWICCDRCSHWYHSLCVRINDSLMQDVANYTFYCETCTIRGTLIARTPLNTRATSNDEIEILRVKIEELTSQLIKLQTDLAAARLADKKQFNRLQGKIHTANQCQEQYCAKNSLINNIEEKLDAIKAGAKLAKDCSLSANSCRLVINKIPYNAGENTQTIVENVLLFLGLQSEMTHIKSCFRLPVKPSKWSDRELTPTIAVVFNNREARDRVIRKYYDSHENAKLCNLKNGPSLEYRFTINEALSINTFRIRNLAIRLKHKKLIQSVYVRNDSVSVLLTGHKRYMRVSSIEELLEMKDNQLASGTGDSKVTPDALSTAD